MCPIFFGADAHNPFKSPVEMRNVVESGAITDVGDGCVLLFQHPAGKINPIFFEIGEKGLARIFFEECAEGETAHVDMVRDIV